MNEKINPYNPNTQVREIRTDGWPVVDLEANNPAEAWEKLGVWAKRQVESWQGDPELKDEILDGGLGLNHRHPADVLPFWITIEPLLMLSNLPTEQLAKIEHLLDLCCHSSSTGDTGLPQREFRQAQLVVGAFRLGRETQHAQSIIQSSGS